MKVADLTAPELDYWVAKAEGLHAQIDCDVSVIDIQTNDIRARSRYEPSTDWSQGGPIIEREKIRLNYSNKESVWIAKTIIEDAVTTGLGSTPLIAAMRCYVASKYGNTVDD